MIATHRDKVGEETKEALDVPWESGEAEERLSGRDGESDIVK